MKIKIHRLEFEDAKITYQETAGLAIISINRPQSKNALTANMWTQLTEIAGKVLDNPKNKVVLLRGSGEQFTAGSDIKEFQTMAVEEAEASFLIMEQAISAFEQLSIPTISVINGSAMGAGLELALACDMRIGSEHARMGIPVGRLGIRLSNKFAQRIVDLIGPSRTKELVYTGRILNANESVELGMINHFVENEKLDRYAIKLGKLIAAQSPASLKAIKQSVANCVDSMEEIWKRDVPFVDPYDFPEGVASFIEKRPPRFKRRLNK